jgi:hypothetical protein
LGQIVFERTTTFADRSGIPDTRSEWAKLARSEVMHFLGGGRYIAVVVDGKSKLHYDGNL